MSDELDALWPAWMVQKRNEIRAQRMAAKAAAEAEARGHVDCSMAELDRQRMQDARRRDERNDAFYWPARFRKDSP